jgi:hypothetical protein
MTDWWRADPVASGVPAPAQGWWSSDPVAGAKPAFGSDEYVTALAQKHGVDPDHVRGLVHSQASGEALKGTPILGALVDKAGAGISALAQPLTGAGASGGSIGERYGKNRSLEQEIASDFEREHPGVSTAAQLIGGGAATGALGATTTGARLLGIVGRNVAERAGYGALSGGAINAADATLRGENPLAGGAIGGVLGAAFPVAGRVASTLAEPVINTIRGAVRPAEQATRNVAGAIQRDVQAGGAGLTQPEFTQAAAGGQPVNLMDLGGETTRALARSAANTSPEGREILNRAIDDRFESQSQRLADWFRGSLNYPTEQAQRQAIRHVADTVYQPRYAQAYRDAATTPLWPDRDLMRGLPPDQQAAMRSLEQIAQAPEVQTAIRIATPQLRNWAVRDGLRPPQGAFAIDSSGAAPRTVLQQTASGNTVMPSLQYWDYVKRALDSMETPTARQFSGVLRNELDTLVPAYRAAR